MIPENASGRPIIWRSHDRATSSSSCAAGAARQSSAFPSKAAESSSPKMPGAEVEVAK